MLVIVFYTAPLDWRYLAAAIVFTVAAITDWLDGYLARKMGQMTPFGAHPFLQHWQPELVCVGTCKQISMPWPTSRNAFLLGLFAHRELHENYEHSRLLTAPVFGKEFG